MLALKKGESAGGDRRYHGSHGTGENVETSLLLFALPSLDSIVFVDVLQMSPDLPKNLERVVNSHLAIVFRSTNFHILRQFINVLIKS